MIASSMDAANPPRHPDAELLALRETLETAWAVERRIDARPANDDEVNAAVDATSEIAERIAALPATTLEGLRVKALAVMWCGHDDIGLETFGDTTDLRIAGAIVRDLLRVG